MQASDASEFGFRGWEVARNLCGATSPLRVIAHVHAVPGSGLIDSGRGAASAEDAQGTPTQTHISPSILVYEDYAPGFEGARNLCGTASPLRVIAHVHAVKPAPRNS